MKYFSFSVFKFVLVIKELKGKLYEMKNFKN